MRTKLVSFLAVSALAAVLLCSCATPVAQEDRAAIRRVAVVSDLPRQLVFHTMGFLPAFQNEHTSERPSLDVAAKAEGVVAEALAKKGYSVVAMAPEFRNRAVTMIARRFSKETVSALADYSSDIDAVVFVVSQQNQGLYGGETGFGGVEIIPSKIFGTRSMLINCNTGVFIYSTSSLKRIGVDVEARGGGEVRGVEFHERWDDFSASDQRKLIEQVEAAIDAAIRPRIEKLL